MAGHSLSGAIETWVSTFLRSLFRRSYSLFSRINSLFALDKFPVPVRREFPRKCAKVRAEFALKSERIAPIRGNSLFISLLAGNSADGRRVRGRLPPPPSSPASAGLLAKNL